MYTDKLSIFPYALTIELYSIEMDHIWLRCDWCFKKPVKNHNIQTSKWDNDSWNANYDKLHSSLSCPFLPSIIILGHYWLLNHECFRTMVCHPNLHPNLSLHVVLLKFYYGIYFYQHIFPSERIVNDQILEVLNDEGGWCWSVRDIVIYSSQSSLIGRKRTVNFRNQRLGRHLAADYTIIKGTQGHG